MSKLFEQCVVCKQDAYLNSENFYWMTSSKCGHKICNGCFNQLYSNKSKTNISKCPMCRIDLKESDWIKGDLLEREMEKDLQKRREVTSRCKRSRNTFATIEEYYDFLEQIDDLVHNFREGIDLENTRNKLDNLAKLCEDQMKLEEKRRLLRIDEADEEFDWQKLKLPSLLDKDKSDQLRNILDLKSFDPKIHPEMKKKIQKASGFSNEFCHSRGFQELKSCFKNFL